MKTPIAALTFAAAALCAGSALAQTRPQTPAPRTNPLPPPPPAVGTVPAGQGQGQTRGTAPVGDPPVAAEAIISTSRSNIVPPRRGEAPTAIADGGTISGTPDGAGALGDSTSPAGDPPVAAEAAINTTRSNIKRPSSLAVAPEAGASPVPAPAPVTPR